MRRGREPAAEERGRPDAAPGIVWSRDVAAGDWLRERLDADSWATMHTFVPRGFPAYARVLHPGTLSWLDDGPLPTDAEWERLAPAEHARIAERIRHRPVGWRETAETFGTVLHPLAQWHAIVGGGADHGAQASDARGRGFDAPPEGWLEPALLARVLAHAVAATSTPDSGWAAVWNGWGGLLPDEHGRSGASRFGVDERGRRFHEPVPAALPREVATGPMLELPHREHVCFRAAPRVWTDPAWTSACPWAAQADSVAPSLIWPDDRAWVVVSEIDCDSTIVAGSAALVRAICADPGLEALPIRADAELHWDADAVNRPDAAG